MKQWALSVLLLSSAFLSSPALPAGGGPAGPHRSPTDLAVRAGGRQALTANHTADTVSLVDLGTGAVLAERPCGRKPVAVACAPDGRHAAVSNSWSGSVTLFDLGEAGFRSAAEISVGPQPHGLAFAPGGGRLFVALGGAEEVVALDVPGGAVRQRWPAPREPRRVVVSADGAWVAAASSRSGQVRLWDARSGKLAWERTIEDAFNLRGLAFTPDGRALVCAHSVRREFPVSRENVEEGWVIDSRLTRLPLAPDAVPPLEQVALDARGRAVGDPDGLAFGAAGRTLALAASGSQELLLFDRAALPWNAGDPGDVLDARLANDPRKLRRLPLGGRPLGVAFLPDSRTALVANYLLDAVQLVDVEAGKLVRTVPLGGPARPSLARRGEALFYDARRSHHQWFSCHTCHVDGHTCGLTFDTLNDDSYGNPKLTPSLRGVARTGPWTWHGWQKDLGAGVEKSYTQTMFGPPPTPDELRAVVAFLETLDHPPNPHRGPGGALSDAARRGMALFEGKARCARCHPGPEYTTPRNYDVGLEADGSPYPRWNPPSLRGLADRGPYLHDGRARTLDELLEKHHAPERLKGQALTPAERQDLIAYLRSL